MFKHLLPRAKAWAITKVDKTLRLFFDGLSGMAPDFKLFDDEIWLDIFPRETRELEAWEEQFYLVGNPGLTEQERRDRLDATWKAEGGQSPKYIQDTIQAQGFTDVYIHEWWIPGSNPAIARNPNDYSPTMLVNKQQVAVYGAAVTLCGETIMECGEPAALCGEKQFSGYTDKVYPIPSDPDEYPYVLYFGGQTFPGKAIISPDRQDEFERLLLKICPAQQWIGLLINYGEVKGFKMRIECIMLPNPEIIEGKFKMRIEVI